MRDPSGRDRLNFVSELKQAHVQMRKLAVRVCHNSATADDALQVAYAKAYVARDSYRGDAEFSTWLYRIVYRCCIDELRKLKPVEPLDAALSISDRDFEERVDEALELRQALRTLTPEQRAAVWLVDAEGYSYAAAAEMLDVAVGTISSRVARARQALLRALGVENEEVRP